MAGRISKRISFFNECFIWTTGEYEVVFKVTTDIPSADIEQKYRFMVFESHEADLRRIAENYKFRSGIYFENKQPQNVIIELKAMPS